MTISSDFGPRHLNNPRRSPYDWHQGIDYSPRSTNNDLGYVINSINSGIIYKIAGKGSNGSGLKYLVVQGTDGNDYGYVHIFNSDVPLEGQKNVSYGSMSFVLLSSHANRFGILRDSILLSDCPSDDCSDYYFIDMNDDTTYASNVVSLGDELTILGQSGTLEAHLHLNLYDTLMSDWGFAEFINDVQVSHAKDPLTVIEHNRPDYNTQVLTYNGSANIDDFIEGISIKYSSHAKKVQEILVRPEMVGGGNGNKYDVGDYAFARTELLLSHHANDTSGLIQGPFYYSYIDNGSRFETPAYPPRMNMTGGNALYGRFTILGASTARTGIFPVAYRDGNSKHPYGGLSAHMGEFERNI